MLASFNKETAMRKTLYYLSAVTAGILILPIIRWLIEIGIKIGREI